MNFECAFLETGYSWVDEFAVSPRILLGSVFDPTNVKLQQQDEAMEYGSIHKKEFKILVNI